MFCTKCNNTIKRELNKGPGRFGSCIASANCPLVLQNNSNLTSSWIRPGSSRGHPPGPHGLLLDALLDPLLDSPWTFFWTSSGTFPGPLPGPSRTSPGHFPDLSIPGPSRTLPDLSQTPPGTVPDHSGTLPDPPGLSWRLSEHPQIVIRRMCLVFLIEPFGSQPTPLLY